MRQIRTGKRLAAGNDNMPAPPLGHSFHEVLPLIQVADLIGVYGVSFVAAAVNGCVADILFARWTNSDARSIASSTTPIS